MNTQDEWLGVDAWALAGAFDELEQRAQAEQAQEAAKRLALEAQAAAERQRQEDEAREHRRLIREAGRNGRREARRKLGADVFAVNPDQIYQEWFHGGGRPSVGRVLEAIDLLCEALPPQWRPAVERIAAVPKDAAKRALWHFTDAWAALERLDAFRKQHGDALAWAMDDDEICELAERQADNVRDALGRIFNRHRVTEKTGERARQRLAAHETFLRETAGKTEWQLRHETGRDLTLWRSQALLDEGELAQARGLVQRLKDAMQEATEWVAKHCAALHCEPPQLRKRGRTHEEVAAALARVRDVKWWRPKLREAAARIVEAGAIKLGMVNRRTGGYVSNHTLKRRQQQLRRNENMLGARLMKNEAGQIFRLAELVAASVANPVNRGGELMTRIRGCEECADERGHVGLFVTLTTPSAMHPMLSKDWRDKSAEREAELAGMDAHEEARARAHEVFRAVANPRYDGTTTPRDAQQWLSRQWARVRAALAKAGIKVYGFRVAEPHHDGTPHWHMLLWCEDEAQAQAVQDVIYRYWVDNDKQYANERGARKNRVNFKRLAKGGAAGYIAKYIAKSIGHHALKEHMDEATGDLFTVEMGGVPGHMRVDAWASTWRIRQFQPIGQPSVTAWREIRRVTPDQVEALNWKLDAKARLAWDAAQKIGEKPADWHGFMRAMGGPCLPRKCYALQVAKRRTMRTTRYGESVPSGKVVGVVTPSGKWLISRRLGWREVQASAGREAREAIERAKAGLPPQDEARRRALARPWTGFNNCSERRRLEAQPDWIQAGIRRAEAAQLAQKWAVIEQWARPRYLKTLQMTGATAAEMSQAQLLHGRELLQRLGLTVHSAVDAMQAQGLAHERGHFGRFVELAVA